MLSGVSAIMMQGLPGASQSHSTEASGGQEPLHRDNSSLSYEMPPGSQPREGVQTSAQKFPAFLPRRNQARAPSQQSCSRAQTNTLSPPSTMPAFLLLHRTPALLVPFLHNILLSPKVNCVHGKNVF